MAQDTLICYITGNEVKATPEELIRQEYARRLVEDYGYTKECIRFEYPIKTNPSDSHRSGRVDIAVLENEKPKIFIETKATNVKEGLDQLKGYMAWDPSVLFGVWTNGNLEEDDLGIYYIRKVVSEGAFQFVETHNIPTAGSMELSEQRLRIKDLIPSTNLKSIFRQMRGYIAANATGTTRDEKILNELMSIVLCKIYDERYKGEEDYVEFYVVAGDYSATAKQIKDLFEEKVKRRYATVFDEQDSITIDDVTLVYIVSQLERYSLLHSPSQVVSDAFETIISYASKGSQGQFFTPSNVVELMVAILAPSQAKVMIDPAAGTAGFLSSAMRYVWNSIDASPHNSPEVVAQEKHEYATQRLFGIEKDSFLAKMSKAYMTIMGDGKSGIFVADSLEVNSWNDQVRAKVVNGTFDYVLTNPPFGKDVKVKRDVAERYFSPKIDLMFLERSIDLLCDGGVLGIVLPETVFHSPLNKEVRERFFYKHNIQCLIDLPHDTFRPYNNAKCDVIFIQKNRPQQSQVLCVNVEHIGHDHLGRPLYYYDKEIDQFDSNRVMDDIPHIIQLLKEGFKGSPLSALSSDGGGYVATPFTKVVPFDTIRESEVLVARNYFAPTPTSAETISLARLEEEGVIRCFDGHGSPRGFLKGEGSVPYIRVKDIVNLEVYINDQDLIPEYERDRLFSEGKRLECKDILFVRRGSYRIGDVGMLYEKDLGAILTRELLVIRVVEPNNPYGITAHNLLYLINSKEVKAQLPHKIMMDTTLPNIGERWRELLLPLYDKVQMGRLSQQMEAIYHLRATFWKQLEDITL